MYIEAVVNGCSLLRIDDSFDRAYVDADTIRVITRGSERLMNVCVIAKKEDASSKQDEYELSIDGNQIVADSGGTDPGEYVAVNMSLHVKSWCDILRAE